MMKYNHVITLCAVRAGGSRVCPGDGGGEGTARHPRDVRHPPGDRPPSGGEGRGIRQHSVGGALFLRCFDSNFMLTLHAERQGRHSYTDNGQIIFYNCFSLNTFAR